jgi:hypothetical protein
MGWTYQQRGKMLVREKCDENERRTTVLSKLMIPGRLSCFFWIYRTRFRLWMAFFGPLSCLVYAAGNMYWVCVSGRVHVVPDEICRMNTFQKLDLDPCKHRFMRSFAGQSLLWLRS